MRLLKCERRVFVDPTLSILDTQSTVNRGTNIFRDPYSMAMLGMCTHASTSNYLLFMFTRFLFFTSFQGYWNAATSTTDPLSIPRLRSAISNTWPVFVDLNDGR